MQLHRSIPLGRPLALVSGGLALAVLPFWLSNYHVFWLNTLAINVMVAVGLNLLVGFSGQLSLGHGGFVALGAYGCVVLMRELGLPAPLALLLAASLCFVVGYALGRPAVRLHGPYLGIATLAFGLGVVQLLRRTALLGGHMGLSVPKWQVAGLVLEGDRALYALIMPLMFLIVAMARNLTRSRMGRAFVAVHNSEVAAQAFGIDVARTKALAFAISAAYAGLAGGLWAFVLGYIHPDMFDFYLSVLFLIMIVVGGLGQHSGAVLGALLVTGLHLLLRHPAELAGLGGVLRAFSQSHMSLEGLAQLRYLVFGAILILVLRLEPKGLYGLIARIWPQRLGL